MVSEGRLPAAADHDQRIDELTATLLRMLSRTSQLGSPVTVHRPPQSPFAPRKSRYFRGAKGDYLHHIPGKPAAARERLRSPESTRLIDEAIEILIAASEGPGCINAVTYDGGFAVVAGSRQFDFRDDPRKMAALRRAVQQLEQMQLIEGDGELYYVSHDGYMLVDNLLSAASLKQ